MAEIRYRPPSKIQWLKAGVGYPVCVEARHVFSPVAAGELSSFCFVLVVQLPSHVQLFTNPWTAPCQASLSLSISPSLPSACPLLSDAIQPSHRLMPSSPSALNLSQGLFALQSLVLKTGQMMCQSQGILSCLCEVTNLGFPGGSVIKESACRCRRHGFNLWVRKISWRRKWQPSILAWEIPWTEETGGLQSMGLQKESDTT